MGFEEVVVFVVDFVEFGVLGRSSFLESLLLLLAFDGLLSSLSSDLNFFAGRRSSSVAVTDLFIKKLLIVACFISTLKLRIPILRNQLINCAIQFNWNK